MKTAHALGPFLLAFSTLVLAEDAKLPESKVTLDFVLTAAIRGADNVKLIQADLLTKSMATLQANAALDPHIKSSVSHVNGRFESAGGAFSPRRTEVLSASIGVSKLFSTGTMISGEIAHKNNDIEYPTSAFAPDGTYSESQVSTGLQQKLWRNGLGYATRENLKAAALRETATELNVQSNLEEWVVGIVDQYYGAWLAKAAFAAAEERLNLQKRLLKVTKIKNNRGTAEPSDVLQVESAVISSEQQVSDAKKSLEDIWRHLVTILKLDQSYLNLDVTKVEIASDNRTETAAAACQKFKQNPQPESAKTHALANSITAFNHQLNAAQSNSKPDLYLEIRAASNGIEDGTSSLGEAAGGKHPQLYFGVGFEMNLGNSLERATYLEVYKNKASSEILLTQEKDNLTVEIANDCRELGRLSQKRSGLQAAYDKQVRRARLEEQRFNLGQIDLFNVIQASNDVTTAALGLKSNEASLRQISWKILRLTGALSEQIKKFTS